MAQRKAAAVNTTRDWLDIRSPLHRELDWLWCQNEHRYEGGHSVLDELWRFDWETAPIGRLSVLRDGVTVPIPVTPTRNAENKDDWLGSLNTEMAPGEHYQRRQDSAIYVNLMEAFSTDIVGHIFQQAPAPEIGLDFGKMGIVRRLENIDTPTRAELFYFNTDGVGVDGSQWDSYWSAQLKLAMATGLRWIYVEAPEEAPRLQRREFLGFRPYLVSFSPRQVVNHLYVNGRAEWFIIKIASRRPKVVNGSMEGNDARDETLVLVRRGNTDLGDEYKGGGWWRYNADKAQIATGNWDKTDGEIPMAPLIYDRHDRMIGRPGLTELGNASIALMNVQSAADFDAWDSAGSVTALRGVDEKGFNLFIRKVREGNRYAPLPTNEENQTVPALTDASQGAVVADVFDKRITSILKSADRIRGAEMTSGPAVSGLAQQAGFTLGNVPRLALVAGNLETCQNSCIHWVEQRWGFKKPSGSSIWSKKFELIKLTSSAQAVLQLETIAGIHSEELESRVILAAAKDEGFVPDNAAAATIDKELRASSKTRDQLAITTATKPTKPQVPGARRRPMPPEPQQTNQPIKTQLDGPAIP